MKFLTDILTNKWFWVGTIGILIAVFVLPKIFKGKGKPSGEEVKDQEESSKAADTDLNELRKKGIYPTYTKTELTAKAETLFVAMNGCSTDNSTILRVFASLKNEADVVALIDAYGKRTLTCAGVLGYGLGTLAEHLSYECDEPTKKALNDAARFKGWRFRI